MIKQKVGRPLKEDGGILDSSHKAKELTFNDAVTVMFSTSPKTLQELSKGAITYAQWRQHKTNYRKERISIEKLNELLDAAGFRLITRALYAHSLTSTF